MSKIDDAAKADSELAERLDELMRASPWEEVLHSFEKLLEEHQHTGNDHRLLEAVRAYQRAYAQEVSLKKGTRK